MTKLKVTRRVDQAKLKDMCIKYNLFTRGNCIDFQAMLEDCEGYTDKTVYALADYIMVRSKTERPLTNICYLICTEAMITVIDEI